METVAHLFFRCTFAKACWNLIGVSVVTSRPILHIIKLVKEKLSVPFFMEIIILMSWSIWSARNEWMFDNIDPQVQDCKRKFLAEFSLLRHRVSPDKWTAMEVWMNLF
jgi:hypothetical protein